MAGSGGVSLTGGPATGRPGVPNGGKSGPGRPAPPKSKPVQVKAHTRNVPAVKNTSTVTHVLPEGFKVRPRGPATNPLLNPNQTLSGKSLAAAAGALTNVQTQGPLTELGKQIAANNAHTRGTINLTGGFYNQLEPFVQSGVDQQGKIAADLKSQLTGIGSDTQSQLQGIGGNAMSSLLKYAPGDNASAATSDLAAQIARQQGLAAQQAGTYRSFGANQSANYGDLGASQLGTYGLQGQEALKGIAQSGTVQNQPLMAKIAGIQASKGALTATNLGKLRQQEVSNGIARAGLGLSQDKIATALRGQNLARQAAGARNRTAQRGQDIKAASDRANRALTAANDRATQANRAAAIAQSNLNNLRSTNTAAANNAANNSTRTLIAAMKGASGKAGKPATGQQANAIFAHIDYVTGEIQNLVSHGIPPAQAFHIVQNGGRIQTGTTASGKATYRTYYPNRLGTQVLNAAYNVRPGGSGLTPGDLAWFRSLGIKNPTRYARSKGGGYQHNAGPQSNKSAPSAGNVAAAGF